MAPEDFIVPFGKFKGRTIGDVFTIEPTYLAWLRDRAVSVAMADALDAFCDEHYEAIAAATDQAEWRREMRGFAQRVG